MTAARRWLLALTVAAMLSVPLASAATADEGDGGFCPDCLTSILGGHPLQNDQGENEH